MKGPSTGGISVTITGFGFTGATLVRLGPNGTNFVIVTDTLITAKTPPGTGTVQVTVTAPTGTSTQTVLFTYTSLPTLSSLNPTSGPTSGGNTATLSGANLSGATSVRFGAAPATILTNTANQITVTAPAGPPPSVNVTVTTPATPAIRCPTPTSRRPPSAICPRTPARQPAATPSPSSAAT
ncbi:IPT/TIG domain-containing protein [Streptomyces kronopolitis]